MTGADKKRAFDDVEFEDHLSSGDEADSDDFDNDDEIIEEVEDEGEEGEEGDEEEDDDENDDGKPRMVWRAGVDPLEEDEVLDYDSSAYDMMHTMTVEWPCLSFQPLRDHLGTQRKKYPYTVYLVAGTQADESKNNRVLIMKAMEQQSNIVATWSENRQVFIWDIQNHLDSLDSNGDKKVKSTQSPIYTVSNHTTEGYALDWSPKVAGRLASGDCNKNIYVTNAAGASFKTDSQPFKGHTNSVEDIQWSPSEENVFASCSIDQTVKVWDIRQHKPAISVKAHNADVNVISWSRTVDYLLVSGSDDGSFKVWDLRNFKPDSPVSEFNYHTGPITSLEWNPFEDSQIIVSSGDNQVTVWDFSLEEDQEEFQDANADKDDEFQYPPQLFFIHQGQQDIKEVHWHPQIPHVAISTALEGFNIFKSSNSEE
eukprot:gene7791-9590_t